jgi:hypothetical protein
MYGGIMGGIARKFRRQGSGRKYLQILEDTNCIPRGIYRLTAKDPLFYHFTVGDVGAFGISRLAEVVVISHSKDIALTSEAEFVTRYYELLGQMRNDPNGIPTYGMVNEKYDQGRTSVSSARHPRV